MNSTRAVPQASLPAAGEGLDVLDRLHEQIDAYREKEANRGKPVRPAWFLAVVELIDAARAVQPESGLDVERLARVLRAHVLPLTDLCAWHMSGRATDTLWSEAARTIAREYVAQEADPTAKEPL